jgi:hypothetical protein
VTTLTEFLLARIAEDEAGIGEYDFDRPHWSGCDYFSPEHMGPECDCNYAARVLADVAAKRRIVELHTGEHECVSDEAHDAVLVAPGYIFHLDPTLKLLALPYSDHPDYREEWKP